MRLILALLIAFTSFSTLADDSVPNLIPKDDDMKCESSPTTSVVGEKTSDENTCYASAKIQAIAYECGSLSDTESFERKALTNNIKAAQEACEEFCKKQGACEGVFTAPSECGLKTSPQNSVDYGKDVVHCPKRCKGKAFNYCSLYHGPFFTSTNHDLFKSSPENCKCVKKD